MPALLLLSCSSSKLRHPAQLIPAIERYTGIFFKVLNKWRREHPKSNGPDVLIISAQFGLLAPHDRIPHYDQRMTPARALILAPQVQSSLQKQLINGQYKSILVNLGRDYLRALEGFDGFRAAEWASGPIGVRAKQLKAWLNATAE
jgi:hypothetical protein